jgi:hypothetical protein
MLTVCGDGEPPGEGKGDGGAAGGIDIGGNGVAFDLLRGGVRVKSAVFSTPSIDCSFTKARFLP